VAPDPRASAIIAPLARRRFLQLGGASVIGAAVLAACGGPGSQGSVPVAGTSPSTTGAPDRVTSDVVLLRTSSSLEHSLLDAYDRALAAGVLPDDVAEMAKTFQGQHREHAPFFEDLTRRAGGEPFTEPNPVVQVGVVDRAFKLVNDNGEKPEDIIFVLYGLEQVAAETFQTFVQIYAEPRFRGESMTVGGVEARHAAVFARLIPNSTPVPSTAPTTVATTTTAASTTAPGTPETPSLAPVFQVPGAFQPLTSVPITIGITTINVDPLGPNSYMYEEPS
jgi:hypothetical protein